MPQYRCISSLILFLILLTWCQEGNSFSTTSSSRTASIRHHNVQDKIQSHRKKFALSMSSPSAVTASKEQTLSSSSQSHYDAVVVGGGPAGMLSAIMLAQMPPFSSTNDSSPNQKQTQPRVIVYDRLPPPPSPDNITYSTDISKYYLLGLGHRGQRALRQFGVWDDVLIENNSDDKVDGANEVYTIKGVSSSSVAVRGRRDWSPGKTNEEDGVIRLAEKAVTSRIIARDKLVAVLKNIIETKYSNVVELRYGWQVDPISFGDEVGKDGGGEKRLPTLQVSRCIPTSSSDEDDVQSCSIENDEASPTIITTDFLIGADGAARTIANAMEANEIQSKKKQSPLSRLFGKHRMPFRVKRYTDDNPRVYKSIPVQFPPHWPHDLNYSARSTNNRVAFEALPSNDKGNYCALMLLRPSDPLAGANCDPSELRQFFDEEFPQFSKLIGEEVMEMVAKKGASSLPAFRYAGPRLHEGGRTVILGDCIHTVKPYYGLGANSALEDVQILSQILNTTQNLPHNLHHAVKEFSNQRGVDSQALVTLSHGMDRPGKLGTMRFVLPLILDSMFHKLAPKLFGPTMFGMFQLEGVGFREIQLRKRRDRFFQSVVIFSVMGAVGLGSRWLIHNVAKLLRVREIVVGRCAVGLLGLLGLTRKMLTKTKSN